MAYCIFSGIALSFLIVMEAKVRKLVGKRFRLSLEIVTCLSVALIAYVQLFQFYQPRADVFQSALLASVLGFQILCDILFEKENAA